MSVCTFCHTGKSFRFVVYCDGFAPLFFEIMKALLHLWMLFLIVLFFTTGRTDRRYQQRRFSDYNEKKDTNQEAQADSLTTLTEGDKPQCLQRNYEPLLSFGDFFLARMTATTERSLLGAYTKNGTILVCTISALCFGMLLGSSFSTMLFRKRRAPTVHRSTSMSDLLSPAGESTSSEEDRSSDTQEMTRTAIDTLHLDDTQQHVEQKEEDEEDGTEANSDSTFGQTSTVEEANGQTIAQSDGKCEMSHRMPHETKSDVAVSSSQQDHSAKIVKQMAVHTTDTDRLCGQLQELTETLRKTQEPLTAVLAATGGISADVGTLKNITRWMAWRKVKKDMWLQATDNMFYGILVMNVALAFCAVRFGRWQDWGLQCDITYFSWSIHSFLGMLWCWVEEQCMPTHLCFVYRSAQCLCGCVVIFLLGCSVWWFSMRHLFSSSFLKRRQPSSTFVLFLTLICTGTLHSITVALLGGSWMISFSVWLLYSSMPSLGLHGGISLVLQCSLYNSSNRQRNRFLEEVTVNRYHTLP